MDGLTDREKALREADGGHRAQLIHSLHDLARWLDANPHAPVPFSVTVQYTASSPGEVDRIAAAIGADASRHAGFTETERAFGPVGYKAVAISSDVKDVWAEAMQVFEDARAETAVAA